MNDLSNKDCCSGACANKGEASAGKNSEILPQNIVEFIEQCLKGEHPDSYLIAVLHKAQDHFGYLSAQVMDTIAHLMRIPAAKVSGVASFYSYFRLKPSGKHVINVCLGTACYVRGAEAVLNKFSEELGIKEGETTKDGMFSLEVSRCLGTCALAPVVKVGKNIYAQTTPDKVALIVKNCLQKDK